MARQIIDIGIQGNDGTGDSIRESFRKVNDNFQQLFSIFGTGETIAFTDLDDTPDTYTANQIIVVDNEGVSLLAKDLVGGEGILVDHSDPNQVTIVSTASRLVYDDRPTLSNHLNAGGFSIGQLREPSEDLVSLYNNLYGTSATEDDFAISRGYADRRYIQSGADSSSGNGQIRVRLEPTSVDEYFKTIDLWVGGYAVVGSTGEDPIGHGFNTAINGAPFVYKQTGSTSATGLTKNQTYYIRYIDAFKLGVYLTSEDAKTDVNRIQVNVDPEVDSTDRGIETLVDAFYDPSLPGNWLINSVIPRVSAVRRQGDIMEGALILSDHPGQLSGLGSPNGADDLQAATKYYVDSSSYSSVVNLFVSTSGSDIQLTTPAEKQGRALAYAFSSIGRACLKAEELINQSLTEPGPYKQRLTHSNGVEATLGSFDTNVDNRRTLRIFTNSEGIDQTENVENRDLREGSIIKGIRSGATGKVISYNGLSSDDAIYVVDLLHKVTDVTVFEANYVISSSKLETNRSFIQSEVVEFINSKYPNLEYDSAKCARDIGLLLDAVSLDIKFGSNKNTIEAAKAYYRGASRVFPDNQLTETLDAINYFYLITEQVLQNNLIAAYNPPPGGVDTPNDVRKRSLITQDISGNPGEANSISLIRKLVNAILDIVENGTVSENYLEFLQGEPLEYGQPVPEVQISILVETGIYYEQLPIRVPTNVSIKGDEFRRCIIRPAPGESLSPWTQQYFYREDEFDGLTRTYTSDPGASALLNGSDEWEITVASTTGLQEGMHLKITEGAGILDELTQVKEIISPTTFTINIAPINSVFDGTTVIRGLNESNLAPTGENFAYHYLIDPSNVNSRPKQNKNMDMFLLNDGTIIRNITAQGHGGFMCVLDPTGQIQTKSPYIQTCTSLSGSINRQRFAGGMFVDGFSGNIKASISRRDSTTQLGLSGLTIRNIQAPASFFINGTRYQINTVSEYNSSLGTATVILDEFTPYLNPVVTPVPIVIDTPGNRSMLANDFTQINDLGYGCVALNNGIAELVSVFSYYNWTSYYSLSGGQIRSVTGNSSYGKFGLRARGGDPNEVPDEVTLIESTSQQAKIYKRGNFATKSTEGDSTFYIDHYWYIPNGTSEVEIDHTAKKSSLIEDSLTIISGGNGYQVGDTIEAVGGTVADAGAPSTFIVTQVDNGIVGGPGSITGIDIADTGTYASTGPTTFTNSPVGVWPITAGNFNVDGGNGAGAILSGSFLGNRSLYEITTIEETLTDGDGLDSDGISIPQRVLKLNLDIATASSGTQPTLFADLYDGQVISIRSLQKLKFDGILEVRPVRPSTALEFRSQSTGNQILRTLAYELNDAVGASLNDPLPAPQTKAILNFDSNFSYVLLDVDIDNLSAGYGLTANDDSLAVLEPFGEKLSRINSGEIIFFHQGRGHQITGYFPANSDGPGTPGHIKFTDLPLGQGTIIPGEGLVTGFTNTRNTVIRGGINSGTSAFITVRISTCRATSHDFLDVGSGGYNDSNHPGNLYGAPANDPSRVNEVIEETQGRVFYVSTDQNGVFKVGRFFEVDQGTGNVAFNAPITLTDLSGLGFKKGTFVTEFSTDATLTDNDSNAVPVESAVRGYIDRRLGITHEGTILPSSLVIGPGMLPLDGSLGLTGNLNMAGPNSAPVPHKIINLAPPSDNSDAATKLYVDSEVAKFDSLKELKDITVLNQQAGDLILFNPNSSHLTNARIVGDISVNIDFSRPYTGTLQGGITTFPNVDSGIIGTSASNVAGGIVIIQSIDSWPSAGYIQINNEIFKYTNKTNASRRLEGITRAVFSTTAATHSASATVDVLDSSEIEILLGESVINNANISDTAAILQSKLALNISSTRASAPTGTSADIQAASGIASFNNVDFTVTNGFVGIRDGILQSKLALNISSTRASAPTGTSADIQAASGIASFDSANFEVTNGFVGIRAGGVSLTEIQSVPAGSILGYFGGSANSSPQAISVTSATNGLFLKSNGSSTEPSWVKILETTGSDTLATTITNSSLTTVGTLTGLSVSGLMLYSIDNNVAAVGTTQAGAQLLSKNVNNITSGVGAGVRLPSSATLGQRIIVRNETLGDVKVYPSTNSRINSLSANVAYDLPSDATLEFIYLGVTTGSSPNGQWVTPNATLL